MYITFNNVVAVIVELWDYWRSLLLSSTRTFKTDVENWEYVEIYLRYWNKVELSDIFIDGKAHISTSRVKQNSLPISTRLLVMSVSSIRALFQAKWEVFAFWMEPARVPRSLPVIFWVFFKNRWTFWHCFPYGFLFRFTNLLTLRAFHLGWGVSLKVLTLSITMTAHVPKFKNTSSINIFVRLSAVIFYVGVETKKMREVAHYIC